MTNPRKALPFSLSADEEDPAHSDVLPLGARRDQSTSSPGSGGSWPSLSALEDPFSEFEKALESESTRIDEENLLAEESTRLVQPVEDRARLVVVAGKDHGKEFFLSTGETSIGRSIDNDVILTDIAVSRQHLIVQRESSGATVVRDLGSGNGTRINGMRVPEAQVKDGDRFEIGETVVEIRLPGGAQPPVGVMPAAPMPPPTRVRDAYFPPPLGSEPYQDPILDAPSASEAGVSSAGARPGLGRPGLAVLLSLGGIAAALVGALLTVWLLRSGNEAEELGTLSADTQLYEAQQAYEQGRYEFAAQTLRELSQRHPQDARVKQWLGRAVRGQQHVEMVGRARVLAGTDPRGAQRLLADIPSDSPLHAAADELRLRLSQQRVAELVSRGHAALGRGQIGRAQALLTQAGELGGKSNPVLAPLAQAIEQAGASPAPVPPDVRGSSRRARPTARPGSRRKPSRSRTSPDDSGALEQYRAREFSAASRTARAAAESAPAADARRLERLSLDIKRFKTLFEKSQRGAASVSELTQARRLDERISGGAFSGPIEAKLFDARLSAGRAAIDGGNYPQGCPHVHAALSIMSNPTASRMAADCDRRAVQAMGEAEAKEASDPAQSADLYHDAELMAARGSALAIQAYRRRNVLRGRGSVDEDE